MRRGSMEKISDYIPDAPYYWMSKYLVYGKLTALEAELLGYPVRTVNSGPAAGEVVYEIETNREFIDLLCLPD